MLAVLSLATLILSASAHPLRGDLAARHHALAARSQPATWATGYLEDYTVYHTRYLALNCQDQHGKPFFDLCCHPLLATETLEANRAPECTPGAAASSSAAAAEPTSTVVPEDEEEDCEEEDDAPESSPAAPAETPKTTEAAKETKAPESSSEAPKETKAPETKESPSPSPTPSPTSSEAPKETQNNNDNNDNNNNDNNNNNSGNDNNSSGGQTFSGGRVTFYDQGGVAGACGEVHGDYDLIAAMNTKQYYDLDICNKKVEITADNGKKVTVTVVDQCPGCEPNSIDLSRGAFEKLGSFDLGIIKMSWKIVS